VKIILGNIIYLTFSRHETIVPSKYDPLNPSSLLQTSILSLTIQLMFLTAVALLHKNKLDADGVVVVDVC